VRGSTHTRAGIPIAGESSPIPSARVKNPHRKKNHESFQNRENSQRIPGFGKKTKSRRPTFFAGFNFSLRKHWFS